MKLAKKNMNVTISLDGEKEFKKAIKDIKEEQKLLNSESKLTKTIYADNKKSTEALSASNYILTKQLDAQSKKVEELAKRHKEASNAYGENSKIAKDFELQINNEKTSLKKLNNELKRNNEQIEKNVKSSDEFNKKIEKMANGFENVGKKATTFVTLPVVAGLTAGIKGASDFSENVNKLEVAFDGATSKVEQFSKTALTDFGLSKNAVYELTSSYGMLGANQEQAIKLSERSADMASIFNDSIENTSNALKAIYTGEGEPLKKYGVIMTEANVKAYALANGLENLSKEQQRYAYVLEETSIAQDDYKNTSDGLANTTRTIIETFKEFVTNVGTIMLPTVEEIGIKLKDFSTGLLEVDEDTLKVIVTFGLIMAGAGPLIIIISNGIKTLGILSTALNTVTASATASKIALGPVGLAITAVTAVIGAGAFVWKKFSDEQEEARQAMMHSGETALELAENLEKANSNVSNVTALTDEYKMLKETIADNNTSTSELVSAKERLKEIEEQLIEISNNSGLAVDIDNIGDYLPLLNERVALERELLEVQSNSFLASNNYEKLVQEEATLKQSREELISQIKEMQSQQTELTNITIKMQTAYYSLDHESEEYTNTMNGLNNELLAHGVSVQNVDDYIKKLSGKIDESTKALELNNEELITVQNSQSKYQRALEITNGETEINIQKTSDLTNRSKELSESINVTNGAILALNKGESLSAETSSELISLYPELNSYVDEQGRLNSINADILSSVANASKDTALQQIRDEQAKTEATLKGVQTRTQAYAIEFQKQSILQSVKNGNTGQNGLLYDETFLKGKREANELQKQLNDLKSAETEINKLLIKSSNDTASVVKKNSNSTAKTEKDNSKDIEKAKEAEQKAIIKAKEEEQKAILEATKKRLKEEESLLKEGLKEQLSIISDKTKNEVSLLEDASNTKIQMLDNEYIKKIELIDESTGLALQGINDEIDAELEKLRITNEGLYNEIQTRKEKIDLIKAESEAEKEKNRIKKENERLDALESNVLKAETYEERIKAEKDLQDYKDELAYNQRERERQANIDLLQDEVKGFEEQAKKEIEITDKTIKEKQKLQEGYLKTLTDTLDNELSDVEKRYGLLNEALENGDFTNNINVTSNTNITDTKKYSELPTEIVTEVNSVAVDNVENIWINGIDDLFKNISNIFKRNEKVWHGAGMDLGNQLLNGLKAITPTIESIIDELTTRIDEAISLANELNSVTSSNKYVSNTNYNYSTSTSNSFSSPLNIQNFNNNTGSDINVISKQLAQQNKDAYLAKGGSFDFA